MLVMIVMMDLFCFPLTESGWGNEVDGIMIIIIIIVIIAVVVVQEIVHVVQDSLSGL
jgi:hypothetical protein